jgi:hypothetical protein
VTPRERCYQCDGDGMLGIHNCPRCQGGGEELGASTHKLSVMAKKRGYSNEFPTDQAKRIKREIDWVPPSLDRSLRAKLKREGLSLRTLTLRLWSDWLKAGSEKAD